MDIGDIVYLLFVVGGVIYSFIRKQAKESKKNSPSTGAKDSFSSEIEALFDRVNQEPRAEEPAPYSEEEEIVATPISELNQPKKDVNHAFVETQNKKEVAQEDLTTLDGESPILNNEIGKTTSRRRKVNIRAAIVYDAILNRPKF